MAQAFTKMIVFCALTGGILLTAFGILALCFPAALLKAAVMLLGAAAIALGVGALGSLLACAFRIVVATKK